MDLQLIPIVIGHHMLHIWPYKRNHITHMMTTVLGHSLQRLITVTSSLDNLAVSLISIKISFYYKKHNYY